MPESTAVTTDPSPRGAVGDAQSRKYAVIGRPTALAAIVAEPSSAALILDFDGVLSPIVQDPTTSAMPDVAATALRRLVKSIGLLTVMSGRPLDFLVDRVRISGISLLGSYGIERIETDGRRRVDPAAIPWLGKVKDASQELAEILADSPGIRVEEKSVSVAVHWRQSPDRNAAGAQVRYVAAEVADRTGLRLEPGKLVEELRPPIDVHKGSEICRILDLKEPRVIAYAGDDLGDIPALRAVREVRNVAGYALVVDHGRETDTRLLALADHLCGHRGICKLVEWAG